jgi:thiol-disulfide isomerase/thioredoxin
LSEVIWVEDHDNLLDLIDTNDSVVVDFTAPAWCGPCQKFAPHFDTAAEKSDAVFVAVDVDKAPWATSEYGVRGVPTVKHFKGGEFVADIKSRTAIPLLSEIG